jgi:hypothetical protein
MKRSFVLAGILLLLVALWFAANPAQAFEAKNLDITVQQNADAVITFDYELSWVENIAVFMHITDPGAELQKALESNYKKPVTVTVADGGRSQFMVEGFASVHERNGTVLMRTPALSFVEAEKVLNQYWFAPFITPDFSPEVTTVRFPDGYVADFSNQISIPAIDHTLSS